MSYQPTSQTNPGSAAAHEGGVEFALQVPLGKLTDRMILRVGVSGVSGDDVTDPTERAAATNPKPRRND